MSVAGMTEEARRDHEWSHLLGRAVRKGKSVWLYIHVRKATGTEPWAIHFKPLITKKLGFGGVQAYQAFAVRSDGRRQPATAPDISWVAGRTWLGGSTLQGRETVEKWLTGMCFGCDNPKAFPSLWGEVTTAEGEKTE